MSGARRESTKGHRQARGRHKLARFGRDGFVRGAM
jgi:hypothetical protein